VRSRPTDASVGCSAPFQREVTLRQGVARRLACGGIAFAGHVDRTGMVRRLLVILLVLLVLVVLLVGDLVLFVVDDLVVATQTPLYIMPAFFEIAFMGQVPYIDVQLVARKVLEHAGAQWIYN